MAWRRFFAWVWRINSLIVFSVGLISIGLVIVASVAILKDFTRTRHTTGVVNVAKGQIESSTASLGSFSEVGGADVLRAPLNVEQEYARAYGSKETSSTQNYLYFNPVSLESYWLIPGYRGLIAAENEFPSQGYGEASEPPRVVVYELVDNDSNRDKRLTADDTKTIAVSDPSGRNFVRVLNNVEEFKGGRMVNGTSLVILYTAESALRSAEIELPSNKLRRESVLEPVPAEAPVRASSPAQ